jgi:hypothetical protein
MRCNSETVPPTIRPRVIVPANGVIGNYADWLPYFAECAECSMSAMLEAAQIADTLWTRMEIRRRPTIIVGRATAGASQCREIADNADFAGTSIAVKWLAKVLDAPRRLAEQLLRIEEADEICTTGIRHYSRSGGSPICSRLWGFVRISAFADLLSATKVQSRSEHLDDASGQNKLAQKWRWLQWNAATECNIMLPLLAFPKNY